MSLHLEHYVQRASVNVIFLKVEVGEKKSVKTTDAEEEEEEEMEEETGVCGFSSSHLSEVTVVFLLNRQQMMALVGFSIISTGSSFTPRLVASGESKRSQSITNQLTRPASPLEVHQITGSGTSLFKLSSDCLSLFNQLTTI